MKSPQALAILGRAIKVQLIDFDERLIPAKVDTGADTSSIWASAVREEAGTLSFILFGPKSPYYSGKVIRLNNRDYRQTRVANSFGDKELRYVVKLRVRIEGRLIKASFSLANRKFKTYPILLGRRLLKGKFVVDVSQGEPLIEQEKLKRQNLKLELKAKTEFRGETS